MGLVNALAHDDNSQATASEVQTMLGMMQEEKQQDV
jgi:hypothetical protein